jgi:hypothetical protein
VHCRDWRNPGRYSSNADKPRAPLFWKDRLDFPDGAK